MTAYSSSWTALFYLFYSIWMMSVLSIWTMSGLGQPENRVALHPCLKTATHFIRIWKDRDSLCRVGKRRRHALNTIQNCHVAFTHGLTVYLPLLRYGTIRFGG